MALVGWWFVLVKDGLRPAVQFGQFLDSLFVAGHDLSQPWNVLVYEVGVTSRNRLFQAFNKAFGVLVRLLCRH